MRRPILLPLIVCISLLSLARNVADGQDLDVPRPPGVEFIAPDSVIPEGIGIPQTDAEIIAEGFPIGAPVSMIDTPLTPVPYPGVELWEGFCNHHDGLADCCCECKPCAWGSIDILWLQRDEGDTVDFAEDDGGDVVLRSSQFGFDYEAGLRLTYGRIVGCTPFELTYFGTHNWNSTIDVEDSDDLYVPIDAFVNGAFSEADFVRAHYSSDLDSLELNALHYDCCRDFTLLAGLRFVAIDERFDLRADDANDGEGRLVVDANNYLIGPQVGGMWERTCGRWSLGASAKAGVYLNFNEADYYFYEENAGDDPLAVRAKHDSNDASFVGEVLVGASYCLGAGFSLRAGYQLTWIDGVALAHEQFGNNSPDDFDPPSLNTDADVIYDGAYLGLGWTR